MTEMGAAEAAVVARFENAQPAPESWGGGLREAASVLYPGLFPDDALRLHPAQLQRTAEWVAALRAKAKGADRVRALADALESYVAARGRPATGTYDDGLNRAQAAVAADLRRALDGADRTDRGRC